MKDTFTKALAIAGTALVWFPVLAPMLLTAIVLAQGGQFLFDFLMPAELFLFALLGGALLIWAAVRARSRWRLLGSAMAAAVGLLIGSQAFALVSGLASGETEPTGWQFAVAVGGIIGYSLAVLALGVGGILLLGDLFRSPPAPEDERQADSDIR